MRFESQSEAIWEAFPDQYNDIVLVITDLGDVTAVILLLSILYWISDRRKAAVIASYAAAGLAVLLIVKTTLAMPRPDVALIGREYDPYGFPSGHAFNAVLIYGGLLYVFEQYRNPAILTGVITLIVAISVSRVILGVHYLGDIVAGALMAILYFVAMEQLTDREPWKGFGIGVILSLPAIAITSGEARVLAMVALGAAIGGLIGTIRLEVVPALRSWREGVLITLTGLGYIVTVSILESVVAGENMVGIALFHVLLFSGILLLPVAVGRIETPLVTGSSRESRRKSTEHK